MTFTSVVRLRLTRIDGRITLILEESDAEPIGAWDQRKFNASMFINADFFQVHPIKSRLNQTAFLDSTSVLSLPLVPERLAEIIEHLIADLLEAWKRLATTAAPASWLAIHAMRARPFPGSTTS